LTCTHWCRFHFFRWILSRVNDKHCWWPRMISADPVDVT